MQTVDDLRRIATLWQLRLATDRVSCKIYRNDEGLQLRVETGKTVILTEPFDLQPRMLARTEALRASLKRRGWHEV